MDPRGLLFGMLVALFVTRFTKVSAGNLDMLQDLYVANLNFAILVNGFTSKSNFAAKDFSFSGLAKPRATNNVMSLVVTPANVQQIPIMSTLGVSMIRVDYACRCLNPPHKHPSATEMIFALEGHLDVGFITTANVLISETIKKGEKNNDKVPVTVIARFNSQLPGTMSIAATLFVASPPIPDNGLTKAFQIGTKEVEKIKSRLAPKK